MEILERAVVVLALMSGCAPEPIDICSSVNGAGATVELANAKQVPTGYDPITVVDGGELILWEGPQGGYHVWGVIRAIGLYPGTAAERQGDSDGFPLSPIAEYTVSTATQTLAMTSFQKPLQPSGGTYERLGDWVVLTPVDEAGKPFMRVDYLALEGRQATYSVKVTDTCGTQVEKRLSVVLNPVTLEEQM